MAVELRRQVADLSAAGTVVEVPTARLRCACPLFLVPKPGGRWRMIHDLRRVNDFIAYRKFRLSGLQQVRHQLRPGQWMASVDLTAAYHHIKIHADDQPAVGFVVEGRAYMYRALCFGVASAPRLFTKMLQPVVAAMRREGHLVSFYLDDGLVLGRSPEQCRRGVRRLLQLLHTLGFAVNPDKCQLTPTQRLVYLGVVIDTRHGLLLLPAAKVARLRKDARRLARAHTVPLRQLAAFAGRANFAALCLRLGRLHVHPLMHVVAAAFKRSRRWDLQVTVPAPLRRQLLWWARRLHEWNGAALFPPPPPVLTIETDASDLGWGATVANAPPALRSVRTSANGVFVADQHSRHITWKELFAVVTGVRLLAEANNWHDMHVRVRTDASAVVPYLNKMGGRRIGMHVLAASLHHWCLKRRLVVTARHIPGVLNVSADALSRPQTRFGEHCLSSSAWQRLFPQRQPVDLFATSTTTRSPRYFSRVRDPAALGVDAMSTLWPADTLYAFPPIPLLLPLVMSLPSRLPPGARLVLVTPAWASAPWFPLLRELAPRPISLSALCAVGSPTWPWRLWVWHLRASSRGPLAGAP